MRTFATALAAGLLLPLSVHAQPDQLRAAPRWSEALLSGNGRLAVFSVMQDRPQGSERMLRKFMRSNGLMHKAGEGPHRVGGYVSTRPLLEHDHNINNGIPASSVELAGLEFLVHEEDQAKEGLLLGGEVSAGLSYSLNKGQVLSFSGALAYQYSFEHDLDKAFAYVTTCLQSQVASWSWVDLCTGLRALEKGSSLREGYVSAAVTQMFASRWADQALQFKLDQAVRDDYEKLSVSTTLISAIPDFGVTNATLRMGEKIDGQHTTIWETSLALTRSVLDRATTLSASYRFAGGAQVFGEEREDYIRRLAIETKLTKRVSVSLGYEDTASSVGLYDDDAVTLGATVSSWRW